jgi:hypothetical protein
MIRTIGLADCIIGAFKLDVIFNPRFIKEIHKVIPEIERRTSMGTSLIFMCKCLYTKGNKISALIKNLIKTKVKGGICVKASLYTGKDAPQIIFAIIKNRIDFLSLLIKEIIEVSL